MDENDLAGKGVKKNDELARTEAADVKGWNWSGALSGEVIDLARAEIGPQVEYLETNTCNERQKQFWSIGDVKVTKVTSLLEDSRTASFSHFVVSSWRLDVPTVSSKDALSDEQQLQVKVMASVGLCVRPQRRKHQGSPPLL